MSKLNIPIHNPSLYPLITIHLPLSKTKCLTFRDIYFNSPMRRHKKILFSKYPVTNDLYLSIYYNRKYRNSKEKYNL